jgi:hypothetical protein
MISLRLLDVVVQPPCVVHPTRTKGPVGEPLEVPTQQIGSVGCDTRQSAWSSQAMFIGAVPEHIPFETQRSGSMDPTSSAPLSAQQTCVLGSHDVLPQKMPVETDPPPAPAIPAPPAPLLPPVPPLPAPPMPPAPDMPAPPAPLEPPPALPSFASEVPPSTTAPPDPMAPPDCEAPPLAPASVAPPAPDRPAAPELVKPPSPPVPCVVPPEPPLDPPSLFTGGDKSSTPTIALQAIAAKATPDASNRMRPIRTPFP